MEKLKTYIAITIIAVLIIAVIALWKQNKDLKEQTNKTVAAEEGALTTEEREEELKILQEQLNQLLELKDSIDN